MGNGTDFDGSNAKYTPPEGVSEDRGAGSLRDVETNPPGFSPIAGINPHDDTPQSELKDRIPLEFAAREVLNRFRELESTGAHTKDREYAITLLGKALD